MTWQEKQLRWQINAAGLKQLEDDVVLNQEQIRLKMEGRLCRISDKDLQMLVDWKFDGQKIGLQQKGPS